ncbi:MAG TPA: adenylyl-sulfate kinase [Anaeromyxobacteraceae bacterium]|nr:adenylyl-sulfate kinase [Anaeromyxobacteraceae bacterium]
MDAQGQTGFVIWLTGMKGSGKSTLARHLHHRFAVARRPAELLDADDPGEILTRDLGATREDRDASVRRIGRVAQLLARHGVVAVCASLSPFRDSREAVRREIRRFVEVFVDCPMEVLITRDPVYKKALSGEVKGVPGVDDPYEPPTHPDLTVRSDEEPAEGASRRIFQALVDLKYVGPSEFGRLTGGARPRRTRPVHKKAVGRALVRKAPKRIAARTAQAAGKGRR